MKIYRDIIQGGDDWKAIRKGRPTASRFSDIITAAKGDLSKSSVGYIRELIGECFVPDFQYWEGNQFTERGTALEGEALEKFVSLTGLSVEIVGFVVGSDGICGCSPDALVLDDKETVVSGVEIKCPTPKVHIGYVLDGGLPDAYRQQVHGSMAMTGMNEWHFFSYFPGLQSHHVIVKRDDYTRKLEDALRDFVANYRAARAVAEVKIKLPKI